MKSHEDTCYHNCDKVQLLDAEIWNFVDSFHNYEE